MSYQFILGKLPNRLKLIIWAIFNKSIVNRVYFSKGVEFSNPKWPMFSNNHVGSDSEHELIMSTID